MNCLGARRDLVAEHEMVDSRTRRKRSIDGSPGYRTALVQGRCRVPTAPIYKGGIGQYISFDAIVAILPTLITAAITVARAADGYAELTADADIQRTGWNGELPRREAAGVH